MRTHALDEESNLHGARERTILVSLIVDFVLFLPDIAAAIMAGSLTLMADALKCANELLATFLSWLTIRKLRTGKAVTYDYGLGKLENLTGLIIGNFMLLSFALVLFGGIHRLHHPEPLGAHGVVLALFLMSLGVCVNGFLWVKNFRLARKDHSPIMEAQWRVFRAKTVADATVLAVLLATIIFRRYAWSLYIDPVASFFIAGFLLFSFFGVISSSVFDLLDKTLEESHQLIILRELAAFFDDYKNLHGIRSRRAGGNVFIDILLEFEGDKHAEHAHRTADKIKSAIESKIKRSSVAVVLARHPHR